MEAIGQLTGGVAHDFNNLLMVIIGGLDILDRQDDPQRRRRLMEGMRQAASRGSALTRQLLAFARRQNLTPQVLDLTRQLGDMRELLDRSLGGDVHVEMVFAPDLWPVEADPGELELVVLNLAVNARDAMPGGGAIRVEADNRHDLKRGELQGDFVRLRVIDSGVGMSPEVVQRVFEPFFTTKEVGKGSGLGLPQVYGFARQSGGGVEIDSAPAQGTTVSLLLPRSTKSPLSVVGAPDAGAFMAEEAAARLAGHVLLVEDDDEVAALVGDMLDQLHFEVTRASSADAALGALADERQIDLVLSDVMMPGGMNGVELAREVRRRRPGLPLLLTSGYAEQVRREVEAEGIALLPKPYNLHALAAAAALALRAESQR
jgi:CheY-like chemotaxis protein